MPVEPVGRLTVPTAARPVFGADGKATGASVAAALVIRRGGTGAPMAIDHRGRLQLPAWLRCAARASGGVLVVWRFEPDEALVIAPANAVDELADRLVEVGR